MTMQGFCLARPGICKKKETLFIFQADCFDLAVSFQNTLLSLFTHLLIWKWLLLRFYVHHFVWLQALTYFEIVILFRFTLLKHWICSQLIKSQESINLYEVKLLLLPKAYSRTSKTKNKERKNYNILFIKLRLHLNIVRLYK